MHMIFIVHNGYVAFICSDRRTGSEPGRAKELIIRKLLARFKPDTHEVI